MYVKFEISKQNQHWWTDIRITAGGYIRPHGLACRRNLLIDLPSNTWHEKVAPSPFYGAAWNRIDVTNKILWRRNGSLDLFIRQSRITRVLKSKESWCNPKRVRCFAMVNVPWHFKILSQQSRLNVMHLCKFMVLVRAIWSIRNSKATN